MTIYTAELTVPADTQEDSPAEIGVEVKESPIVGSRV